MLKSYVDDLLYGDIAVRLRLIRVLLPLQCRCAIYIFSFVKISLGGLDVILLVPYDFASSVSIDGLNLPVYLSFHYKWDRWLYGSSLIIPDSM